MIWLTKAQRRAVWELYMRNKDGSTSYREFRRRVIPGISWKKNAIHPPHDSRRWSGSYVMVGWCGMYGGIELDGHRHT